MASLQLRTFHAYVGMLIAPTVIFFATTGVLQIYNLHEARPGYTPPALFEELGSVHKDQRLGLEHHGPPSGSHASHGGDGVADHDAPHGEAPHGDAPHGSRTATTLLKIFFTAVAVGLIFSVGSGVWMAFRQTKRKRTHALLLALGTLVPMILAALTG